MRNRLKARWPFIAGAVIALTLATLLVRIRYELEMLRQQSSAQKEAYAAAGEIAARLYRIAQRRTADAQQAHDWHRWQPHLGGFSETPAPIPVAESTLRSAYGTSAPGDQWRVLGPFATEQGRNILAVEVSRHGSGPVPSGGDWLFADELFPEQTLARWLAKGYRLQLRDETARIALYQSEEGELDEPVVATVPFGDARLALRASPKRWHVPPSYLSSCLMVLAAVAMWLAHELRSGQVLQNALDDAELSDLRRREANEAYGNALQSVAALESELHVASKYDTATGLSNRRSLLHRIENTLDAMRRGSRERLGVMVIGFDQIQHIANSFGAEFAARAFLVAAQRVEFVLCSRDPLFRTSDFQLAVVPPSSESLSCEGLAQLIVAETEAPISLDSRTFMLHPSVGVVETHSGYEEAEALLDKANAALGAVPGDSQVRYCFFDSAAAKDSVTRLQLEADLGRAFNDNEFVLEFEPLVHPATHEVAGFEALIRWDHPAEGRIAPARFIPIVMRAGMMNRLNDWVMREAARQASIWYHAGYRELFVNFNMAAEAFSRPDLADQMATVLAEFELPGRNLIIELTESTLIQDARAAARTLARLGELDVGAWLDGFGSGYSSLSYLRALPLKGVKIDRSFVGRTVIDARDFGFLKALIDLIGYLGMYSIAAGIETHEQYELLSLTACNLFQGHHFARSMPPSQAERWMQQAGHLARQEMSA